MQMVQNLTFRTYSCKFLHVLIFMICMWDMLQLNLSDLNLVYACTREKTLMIDVQAREISEKDLEAALRLAHPEVSNETHVFLYMCL